MKTYSVQPSAPHNIPVTTSTSCVHKRKATAKNKTSQAHVLTVDQVFKPLRQVAVVPTKDEVTDAWQRMESKLK